MPSRRSAVSRPDLTPRQVVYRIYVMRPGNQTGYLTGDEYSPLTQDIKQAKSYQVKYVAKQVALRHDNQSGVDDEEMYQSQLVEDSEPVIIDEHPIDRITRFLEKVERVAWSIRARLHSWAHRHECRCYICRGRVR